MKFLEFAESVAREAGEIILKYYVVDQNVEIKPDNSPVTIADKLVNTLVIEKVKAKLPEHGVLGEEEVWQPEKEKLWVCDPIDGTKAYTLHIPVAMFSLAYVEKGTPLVAVAFNPFTNELFSAVRGQGALLNGEPVHVSTREWGEKTRLVRSDSEQAGKHLLGDPMVVNSLAKQKVLTHTCPGAVFRACTIARGSFDGNIFYGDGAHDIAAAKLIVEEAGGIVTSLTGNEQQYNQPINGAIISNGYIHGELTKHLKEYLA